MKLGVVMDPIATILPHHDSTLAMLWEAKARGWPIYYFEPQDLFLRDGQAFGRARLLDVYHDMEKWFDLGEPEELALKDLDLILMRKDPPINEEYIYLTQILDFATQSGVRVANSAEALRNVNEKLITGLFSSLSVPTLVTSSKEMLQAFWEKEKDIVCKPLHAMGGFSVFHLKPGDVNATVIFELLTRQGCRHVMAQRYIPEIVEGDKRILLIHGEAYPQVVARVPSGGDWRGNMAVGAVPVVQPLTAKDQALCAKLKPFLQKNDISFAGIDVIGDYLTEVNLTSPTGIRELEAAGYKNVCTLFFDGFLKNA